MSQPVTAAIALGSNLGDRRAVIADALAKIAALPDTSLLRASDLLETEPVDSPEPAGPFLNAAALIETTLPPDRLLHELLAIEQQSGRRRSVRNAPRTLDLDLLLYGDWIIDQTGLKVPHPRMLERDFMLWPLLQIAPKAVDPRTGKPLAEAFHNLKSAPSA